MRYLSFLLITLICAVVACQKPGTTDKTTSTMNVNQKHASPLVDTFQLADDLLIPYRTKDSLFGYVNRSGEMVIEPQWLMATPFANGRAAVVMQFSKWQQAAAMIDRKGNLMTEYTYTRIAPSGHPGHWQVQILGGQWGILDSLGKEIIPIGFERMGYVKGLGWYLAKLDGKLGYIDASGKIMLPFEYERLEYIDRDPDFSHFWCKKDGRYLYLDKDLNQFIEETFEDADAFINGRARIKKEGRMYMINIKAEEILDLSKYDDLGYTHPNIGIVGIGSYPKQVTYGLVNLKTGEEITNINFANIDGFHEGYAVASTKDKETGKELVGIINEKGEWTVQPKYKNITYYYQGNFKARRPNEKQASELIDANGEILYKTSFFIDSFFLLKDNEFLKLLEFSSEPNPRGVIDFMGNEILPIKYTDTSDDAFGEDGLMQVRENGIYYYVDIYGNEYIER